MRIDLLAERLNRGLSLGKAADEMQVDKSVLWRAEQGKSRPNAPNAFRIASFYGFQVTEVWPLEEPDIEATESAA